MWTLDESAWSGTTLRLGGDELSVTPDGCAVAFVARDGEAYFEIAASLPVSGTSGGAVLEVRHPWRELAHLFVPHLSPEPGDVVGDFVFRAPAVIFATSSIAVALVPDLDDVGAAEGWRAWLDYEAPERKASFGAGAYRMRDHVFFAREEVACTGQRVRMRIHVLVSDAPGDVHNPYGMAARFLWNRWGRRAIARGTSAPLTRFAEHTIHWAFSDRGWGESVWQSFERDGVAMGAPVFIVDVSRHPSVPVSERRWREPRSIWNQAWFSTQRCANGLLRHARRIGSSDLERRARLMTEVALAAPARDGLFPAVLTCPEPASGPDPGWSAARWTNSDRRPRSASESAYHLVDAAFTARMLLEWHSLTGDPRAFAKVEAFADRAVRLALPSGAFPGWIEPDGRVVDELREGPESAVTVTLLFELAARAPSRTDWRGAAERGLAFVRSIIDDGRWEDFETYWSCAPWGAADVLGRRVPRNGVYKQNTLSMAWCSEAMLAAWKLERDRASLDAAVRASSELALYQAVWDPPWLPAPAAGGFGVMNGDSEWNDARQSLFAPFFMELYRETGDPMWFERGVGALQASFGMMYCPENPALVAAYERRFPFFGAESHGFMMENQAHGSGDPIGEFCIFSWGNGSALAAAATVHDRFGDVYVDGERGHAFGVDAIHASVIDRSIVVVDRFARDSIRMVRANGPSSTIDCRSGTAVVAVEP